MKLRRQIKLAQEKVLIIKRCFKCDLKSICCESGSPFLTDADVERLERSGKFDGRTMSLENTADGSHYRSLRLNKDGSCIFFDRTSRLCKVYAHRPIDCRLFPLDICSMDGEYYWICYDCGIPEITEEMIRIAEQTILPALLSSLDAYTKAPSELYSKGQYRVLRKVNLA